MILQKPVLSFKCNDFLKMANLKAISSSATLISPKVTRFDGLEAGERQFLSLSDLPGDAASGHSRIKCPGWRQRKQTLGEPVPHPSGLLERSPVADCYQKIVDVAAQTSTIVRRSSHKFKLQIRDIVLYCRHFVIKISHLVINTAKSPRINWIWSNRSFIPTLVDAEENLSERFGDCVGEKLRFDLSGENLVEERDSRIVLPLSAAVLCESVKMLALAQDLSIHR